jgi:tetratricopeptide (TPR) repeat protein
LHDPSLLKSPAADAKGSQIDAEQLILPKSGQPFTLKESAEDLQPTDDVNLAAQQVDAYPDDPEAHFIYAVALTRTSRVEDALKEVRTARRLAMAKGGYGYFDKMINSYEELLANVPDDNRIRYGLAWAYYMKAYLLAQDSKKASVVISGPDAAVAAVKPTESMANGGAGFSKKAENKKVDNSLATAVLGALNPALAKNVSSQPATAASMPTVPTALSKAAPFAVPQVKQYYELALKHLDDLLSRKPDDVWAAAYRWHLYAEYSGNLDESMSQWKVLTKRFPNNPALYLFLAEGWLKKGNLKESISNASHAIMLRAVGN